MAHADVFEIGDQSRFLFVLFGGSGVDEEEYEIHARSVIPLFDRLLRDVEAGGLQATLVHVRAPWDVPFNRFAREPASALDWTRHVVDELLEPWSTLPWFVAGFSGGAALALHGVHAVSNSVGAAALGADAIPPDFTCPAHWHEKLQLYSARQDRVCQHPSNRSVAERLVERGDASEFWLSRGSHRLADYATPDCLGNLLQFARRLVTESP